MVKENFDVDDIKQVVTELLKMCTQIYINCYNEDSQYLLVLPPANVRSFGDKNNY